MTGGFLLVLGIAAMMLAKTCSHFFCSLIFAAITIWGGRFFIGRHKHWEVPDIFIGCTP